MSSLRLNIDLSIPESETGTRILNSEGQSGIVLPPVVVTKLQTLRTMIRDFKQYARKINEGQPNEEASVRAEYFICHHDSNGTVPDEARQEI